MTTEPALVADIGGTNARFALAEYSGAGVSVREVQAFRVEDFETIRDAVHAYLEAVAVKPAVACFAVAAPTTDAVIAFTNSPWVLDTAEMKAELALRKFEVVNDFEALASGVRWLQKDDLLPVKSGAGDPAAPVLVIGPGTGLGQALIVPFGGRDRIVATQGGHVAFAPRDEEEIEILKFVAREHRRVSLERLLSGRGLVNIHRALCSLAGVQRVSLRADEITNAALTREYPIAVKAVELFCAVLGAAAGDAVMATGARGGVVLGGGILPKIREIFLKSRFIDRFLDKGRMREYVEDVPVSLIIRDGAALIGAASRLREADNEN